MRHYGLLANRGERQRLAWCGELVGACHQPSLVLATIACRPGGPFRDARMLRQ